MNNGLKKLFIRLVQLGIGTLLIMTALFFLSQKIRPADQNDYMFALLDKHQALKEDAPNGRIIFIGGSNLPYGLDSEKIEKAFNKKVINMGITAGLGLKFMVNDVKDDLTANDIVVVSMEYPFFFDRVANGSESLSDLLFYYYPEGFKKLGPVESLNTLKTLPGLIFKKIETGVVKKIYNKVLFNAFYQRKNFNKYGDMVGHLDLPSDAVITREDAPGNNINNEAINFLNESTGAAKEKGANFYLLQPPLMKDGYKSNEKVYLLEETLKNNLDMQILSNPEKYMMDEKYFFNGIYHLNKEGREIRTRMVIEDLKKIIKP